MIQDTLNGSIASGNVTFKAAAALSAGQLVKYAGNNEVDVCGADEQAIGTIARSVDAGDFVTVRLLTDPGIHIVTASGAVNDGDAVYTDAAGKVTNVAGAVKVGTAIQAAAADGDQIQILT